MSLDSDAVRSLHADDDDDDGMEITVAAAAVALAYVSLRLVAYVPRLPGLALRA